MKINISLCAQKPTTNSLGLPIHRTSEGIKNFWKWFGKSKAVDEEGRPLVVYHGTRDDFSTIDGTKFGAGLDQYGSGFYTTTLNNLASGYADGNFGNVMPLYVKVERPIVNKKLTRQQVKQIIERSPDLEDGLYNYGDLNHLGVAKVLDEATTLNFKYQNDCLTTLNRISNDFWRGSEHLFLKAVNDVLGYDGLVVEVSGGKNFVTWFPHQVKSAISNNGGFKGDSMLAKS